MLSRLQAASAAPASPYKILQYEYVPDIIERRGPYRAGHLAAAQKLNDEGKCVIAGAFGDPVAGGFFVFKDLSEEVQPQTCSMLMTPFLRLLPICRLVHLWVGLAFPFADPNWRALNRCCVPTPEAVHNRSQHPATITGVCRLQDIKAYVKADPYVQNGLVTSWCAYSSCLTGGWTCCAACQRS